MEYWNSFEELNNKVSPLKNWKTLISNNNSSSIKQNSEKMNFTGESLIILIFKKILKWERILN